VLHQAKFVLSLELKRLIFTPIVYSKVGIITTWVRMGEDENKWASKVKLVGLFKLQWKAPCHD
jgi:hypothetical protein